MPSARMPPEKLACAAAQAALASSPSALCFWWTLQWMQWAAGQRGRCIRDHAALTCRFPSCRIILLL